jgi:hypothetical protein
MFVSGPNVQNRQLVIVEFFAQKRIQDFYLSDPWLTDQDRVQKVDRDPGMLGIAEHQLEGKIHEWTDSNGHVCLAPFSSSTVISGWWCVGALDRYVLPSR